MSVPVDPPIDPDVGTDALTAPSRAALLTVIGVGGALGTLARYELGVHLTTIGYGWSWATFIANLTGAFALGLLVALVSRHWPHSHYLRPALGTGVLGGYTTFSTYLVETVQRLDHGHAGLALLYVVVTLVGGIALSFAGLALGSRT
ncbi:fluoride efflux transporter CrcB [Acidothermaceae bacterium B102]|nr:fluoride efflux transporter CrcB [Acidothermaceae bacterium B102]